MCPSMRRTNARGTRATVQCLAVLLFAVGVTVLGRAQTQQQPAVDDPPETRPLFRSGVTLVTTDVIVRDDNGQFIADLVPEDFIIFEDNVQQEVSSLVRVHGGRVFDVLVEPEITVREGFVLPRVQKVDDTAGRIFIMFVDDLHMNPGLTPKVRQLFETIGETLVHEGDLFGIISTGMSSVATDLSYDRSLLFSAGDRITGSGFNPREMILAQERRNLGEIRWRAHVAFKTARETLKNLEQIHNRRKVFIYISAGYDFDPFGDQYGSSDFQDRIGARNDPISQIERQGAVFSDAELHAEIAELARAANRANTTFHTVDPRGLMAGTDIEYNMPAQEWNEHIYRTQSSLRSLAELTGGIAIVNRNNFVAGLRDIDAETSDYYVVGFNTNRPEAGAELTRALRIEVNRDGAEVRSRDSYTFEREASQ